MNILGFEITRPIKKALSAINGAGDGGWFRIFESYGGAFQQVVAVDAPKDILAFSAVYACVTMIASDIGKLRVKLMERDANEINVEVMRSSPYLPVLRKPNKWQNRIKFIEQWVISKLLFGNTYVLKRRDARGIVVAMYILDPARTTPLVGDDGSVWYRLSADNLSGIDEVVTVPAAEIIHDMMPALWHPLVGVSPIYACGISATMGNRIQANSTKFFGNMSRPSGMLTAPGTISEETADRLKKHWEENFAGNNLGRLAVLGDGLAYEAMTIPAEQAQLIEQLKWTVEDVARCFHVPLYKLGGAVPPNNTVETLNQAYYSDCLQTIIESAELCLDEGLALPPEYSTEFELSGLLRMDTTARYEVINKAIAGAWLAPNEGRKRENMKPVKGGDSPMIQQQNFSLEALAKRDAREDPFSPATPPSAAPSPTPPASEQSPAPEDSPEDDPIEDAFAEIFIKGLDAAAKEIEIEAAYASA